MPSEYYDFGDTVEIEELSNEDAMAFARAVEKSPYATFRRAFRYDGFEGIEFECKPERVQDRCADIRRHERMAVKFCGHGVMPEVMGMRKDFPRDLLHLNLHPVEAPANLCLYEDKPAEVLLTLTPERLLLRIFEWLRRAGSGDSHLPDQPLEPLLLHANAKTVIIGNDVFQYNTVDAVVGVESISKGIFRAERIPVANVQETIAFIGLPIIGKPWHARVIEYTPKTLDELHGMFIKNDCFDVVEELRRKIIQIISIKDNATKMKLIDLRVLLLVRLPKRREAGGPIEAREEWAFLIDEKMSDLACKLQMLQKVDGGYGRVLGNEPPKGLANVNVEVMKVLLKLEREAAQELSGVSMKKEPAILVIGAGSLGSHAVMNLARQGIGRWRIVDYDELLPHNHARHALSCLYEGLNKAESLASEVRRLLNDPEAASAETRSILRLCASNERSGRMFDEADVILDFSVSQAALHYLSNLTTRTRCMSFFMLQRGEFLVILSEGKDRRVRLKDLEIQLSAITIAYEDLSDIFALEDAEGIRCGGACSDITTVLAEDIVAIQSGIAAHFIKRTLEVKSPSINVWQFDDHMTCSRVNVPVAEISKRKVGGWSIRISAWAIAKMSKLRQNRLPNETGGVLIGGYDVPRKIIYVGDILQGPPDSEEWPNAYIRGRCGLRSSVESIMKNTGNILSYVGEWHTHPEGCSVNPSRDDRTAHEMVCKEMADEGLPGVMLIFGDNHKYRVIIRNI